MPIKGAERGVGASNGYGASRRSAAARPPDRRVRDDTRERHTESCRRQLFPSKEIERWIELGNLLLHLSGVVRAAGRGSTIHQGVAYLGQ